MILDIIDIDLQEKMTGAYKTHPKANTYYAKTKDNKYIHRIIMSRVIGRNLTRAEKVDHINGNGLDNRRKNLRIVTHAQNLMNTKSYKNSSSRFKGVTLVKRNNTWQAKICPQGKTIHLGFFEDEVRAAHEYNKAAIYHFGDMAVLNPVGV